MSTRHSASIYLVQPKPLPEKTPTAPEPIATPTLPHQLRRVLTAKPISAKKLMLSLVSVKRITSDVPVCNEDRNELEIAGERASGDRWVHNSPRGGARQ
ncbi:MULTISPECIES: hypothetical protein [unclassified Microcoleus]|uniref:hypothetical protein n=1 Tax=unclassified Microcoleus TaxID=2642155 RepID=UPI002FCF8920